MTVTMELQGADDIVRELGKLQKQFGKEIADARVTTGNLVAGDARKSVQRTSQGNRVLRYHAGRSTPKTHTASRPGDAPNTDTGQLVKAITVVIKSDFVYVGVGRGGVRDYASWLEFGTKHMAPRPFMEPALLGRQKTLDKLLQDILERGSSSGN